MSVMPTNKPPLTRNTTTAVDKAIAQCTKPDDWRLIRTASAPSTAQSYASFLRSRFSEHDFTTRGANIWCAKKSPIFRGSARQ